MFTAKAFKSKDDKVVTGVCAGMAEHLKIDPMIIRAIWVMAALLTGIIPVVVLYWYAHHLVPEQK